ncbi:MAG: TrpB-like pyridoxal phosphate-dependent enzyme [Alphaproteobacteria bacterium]|nr:TrpB-like pyridoxal phosphate-dependent enzyme [Alphaproteobacteria bacterium]MCB9793479.1 TrpB-like pyridoxal phosphate-dependent enzyme [Alphaproteobacteria bacterium]
MDPDVLARRRRDAVNEILPKRWYNILPDLPYAVPKARRDTGAAGSVTTRLSRSLLAQMLAPQRWLSIPEELRAAYRLWRPTPLRRARALEAELGTPARIYFKYEGTSPTGSFKVNSGLAQAYYLRKDGVTTAVTQTNDGYWGSALAFGGQRFGLDVKVFMMRGSFEVQSARFMLMKAFGAELKASPTEDTQVGRALLARDPQHRGTVGVAISEAMEMMVRSGGKVQYAHGFMMDHVLLHNTLIGLEAEAQMALEGATPDVVLACASSGANFGGLAFPFLRPVLAGEARTRFVAVESAACPSLTRGRYVWEHADRAGFSPQMKMYTVGRLYERPVGHLGSLIFHGMSPTVSALVDSGHVEATAVRQTDAFAAGLRFARCEGILPAPECAHAVHAAIEEALRCKEAGEEKTLLIGISGHGLLDTSGYQAYLDGALADPVPSDAQLAEWLPGGESAPVEAPRPA